MELLGEGLGRQRVEGEVIKAQLCRSNRSDKSKEDSRKKKRCVNI